jgi:hypothetical protein
MDRETTTRPPSAEFPAWAVIDLGTPPGLHYPGKVAAAGFFDENWHSELQKTPLRVFLIF